LSVGLRLGRRVVEPWLREFREGLEPLCDVVGVAIRNAEGNASPLSRARLNLRESRAVS
jgi:hypothetical protein